VLLDKANCAKLCDFGLAREVSDSLESTMMTGGVGTLSYMAPELIDGKYGGAAAGLPLDIYSLGMVYWAMLTKQEPWSPDAGFTSRFAVMRSVMDGERPPIPAGTSKQLETLLVGCWAQKANHRPTIRSVLKLLVNMQETTGRLQ
jgi:serine/threonine protein kinase